MKLVSTADPVTTFLYPQRVSDFKHDIGVDG